MSTVFIIMGVSGSGKSTVGSRLAAELGAPFYDGDDFHPPQNVAKMAQGLPLNDADRSPWLARLRDLIAQHLARGESAVVACSALKASYREQLGQGTPGVRLVYLHGSPELLRARMAARQGHFMKAQMLESQFATLELPSAQEALILSAEKGVADLVEQIRSATPPSVSW